MNRTKKYYDNKLFIVQLITIISILSITSGKLLTHKLEGLILSPPNLSKPVINTLIKYLVIFIKNIL